MEFLREAFKGGNRFVLRLALITAIVFFALRLPETKNRSLEEISEEVTDDAVET
jgi:hypothetical protein